MRHITTAVPASYLPHVTFTAIRAPHTFQSLKKGMIPQPLMLLLLSTIIYPYSHGRYETIQTISYSKCVKHYNNPMNPLQKTTVGKTQVHQIPLPTLAQIIPTTAKTQPSYFTRPSATNLAKTQESKAQSVNCGNSPQPTRRSHQTANHTSTKKAMIRKSSNLKRAMRRIRSIGPNGRNGLSRLQSVS